MRLRTALAAAMAFSVLGVTALGWADLHRDSGSSSSMSPAGAGRALVSSIVIEQATGLRRVLYSITWPDPDRIRRYVLLNLQQSRSPTDGPSDRAENLRAALMIAAGELGRRVEIEPPVPLRVQRAYPEVWGHATSRDRQAIMGQLSGWLELILRFRTTDRGSDPWSAELRPAQLYLDRVTAVSLATWGLAAVSLPLLLLMGRKTVGTETGSLSLLYWWLQALFLFVVGDELVERVAVQSGGPFWLWAGARALVFTTTALLGYHRMRSAGLLGRGTIGSIVGWSAVAVGLIVICVEVKGTISGDLPAVLNERATTSWPGVDLLILAGFSVVLTPLVEETLFRGLLFPGIRTTLGSAGAVGLSAVAFAAIHVGTPERIFFSLLLGLALGIVRERSGMLAPCIVGHSLLNLWWWSRDWVVGVAGG